MPFVANTGLNFTGPSGEDIRAEAGTIIEGIAPSVVSWLLAAGHISPADAASEADLVLEAVEEADKVLHKVADAAAPAPAATKSAAATPPASSASDSSEGSAQ